jgi:hypothetical protein
MYLTRLILVGTILINSIKMDAQIYHLKDLERLVFADESFSKRFLELRKFRMVETSLVNDDTVNKFENADKSATFVIFYHKVQGKSTMNNAVTLFTKGRKMMLPIARECKASLVLYAEESGDEIGKNFFHLHDDTYNVDLAMAVDKNDDSFVSVRWFRH